MVATVVLSMLCVHLLCFALMFVLISTKLHGKKLGMDVFALGCLLLGCAYLLQLLDGASEWNALNVINHTMTLCAPAVFLLGALRFFNRPIGVWRPLLSLALGYSVAQVLVQSVWGAEARHAMLAAVCALLFLGMSAAAAYGSRTFAKDLQIEMLMFAALIAGIGALNALKFASLVAYGLPALDMNTPLQTVFYIYMSFLGTVLPPSIVWLVLRRLTDELRTMAARDPLTLLLNRRGLLEAVDHGFSSKNTQTAHVLILDIDHFKHINDSYGHKVGDLVLSHVANLLQHTIRQGDLACRLGGEEFVVICFDSSDTGMLQLAERIRTAIEHSQVLTVGLAQPIRCTVTIGISHSFHHPQGLDHMLQQADAALYYGKTAGRNRVEQASPHGVGQIQTSAPAASLAARDLPAELVASNAAAIDLQA